MKTKQPDQLSLAVAAANNTPDATNLRHSVSNFYRRRGQVLGLMLLMAACDVAPADEEPTPLPALEAAPCAELVSRYYLIDEVDVPTTEDESRLAGLDLNGDAVVDNRAGDALARIAEEYSGAREQLQASVVAAFSGGRVGWALEVKTCVGGDSYARAALHEVVDTDADSFYEVVKYESRYLDAVGSLADGDLFAAHGSGRWPMSVFFDIVGTQSDVAWSSGRGLTLQATVTNQGTVSGRMAIGLGVTDALQAVSGPMAEFYTPRVGTGNSALADLLDTDGDGAVSPLEFRRNPIIRVFITPDVTLLSEYQGQLAYWPNGPDSSDHITMGIGFHGAEIQHEDFAGAR